jgi:hypothetical protein
MIVKAYSFLDQKLGIFSMPFFCHMEGQAIRIASELATDVNTTVGRHPEDFSLYLVGEFNDNTGILAVVGPTAVTNIVSLLPKVQHNVFEAEQN